MKVLLIFPPLWIPYRPYLALPSLCAYLKSHGVDVVQKDFNAEAYDLLLSENYLKGLKNKLENRFSDMDSRGVLTPGFEQEYYYDLYRAKSSVDYVAEKIEHAKAVFRSKQAFYDIGALTNARNILKQAQTIISTACFPNGQDLIWPMNARLQRTPADIKQITENRDENPYIGIYESHLLPFILKEDPDVVGISITVDGQLMPALTLGRLIKSNFPKAHVVLGGCVVTLLVETLMKYPELFGTFFDSAVVNEGERPLLELSKHVSEGRALADVPNLIFLEDGKVRANEALPAEDISVLPTPCFDGLPVNLYLSPELVLSLQASRGCYWGKCGFCSHNESYRSHYQSRDAAKIADDIEELSRKHGVRLFAFSDEAISPASMSRIADEIIRRGLDVRCSTNARMERQFTPELCSRMFRAGFRLLYFGLESACDRVLEHMGKGITRETATEVCQNAYAAGIWDHLYVFFGFPTETRAEAQETIDFLLSNKNIIRSFSLDNFILARGAPAARFPERYGVAWIDSGPANDFNFAYSYKVSSGLAPNEALELAITSREKIATEYASKKFFQLEAENVILYLAHFEKSDPYLTSAVKNYAAMVPSDNGITQKSIPKLRHCVSLDKTRFDPLDIANNIVSYRKSPAYPRQTFSIFDPASGKLWTIAPHVVEFLGLCDGKRSIEQVAEELTKKYPVPPVKIINDCYTFIKPLAKEGYLVFQDRQGPR